jgi:hypothetical protein
MKLWYASCPGNHRHKCVKCGQVWEHSDDCGGSHDAHTCPSCGREPGAPGTMDVAWAKYLGPNTPDCNFADADIDPDAEPVVLDERELPWHVRDYLRHYEQMCKAA